MIWVSQITCKDCIVRPACVEYERGVQCSLLREKEAFQKISKGFSSKFLEHINESSILFKFKGE